MAVVRLPVPEGIFHTVALYEETTVAIFPKDHHLAAADQLLLSDLSDETLLQAADDMIPWPATAPGHPAAEEPPTTEDAIPSWLQVSASLWFRSPLHACTRAKTLTTAPLMTPLEVPSRSCGA